MNGNNTFRRNDESEFIRDYETFYIKPLLRERFLLCFFEGFKNQNEWYLRYFLIIAYLVLMIGSGVVGWFITPWAWLVCVPLVALFVFLVVKYRKIDNHISQNMRDVMQIFQTAKLLDIQDDVSWWKIKEGNHKEGQYIFTVECRKPGVNIGAKMRDIELAAKQNYIGRMPIYELYSRPLGGVRYELIFDTRLPYENTSELIDFLGQGNGLEPWSLPLNEKGQPKGIIALGAIDKGLHYGEVKNGLLWQHHWGISGASGWGKSNAIHFLMWQISQFPNVQIVYIDPNLTDGELWKERAFVVGRDGAAAVLDSVMAELDRRAEFMKQKGWAKWKAMPQLPQLVVVIDEVKFLGSVDKDALKKIENLLAIGRKYGVTAILGTQYPKKQYIGGAWENLHYRMSSKLNNDTETSVVFGERSAEAPCANITQKGEFYVLDDKGKIERVRVPYVSEDMARNMAVSTSGLKSSKLFQEFATADKKQAAKSRMKNYGF